MPHPADNNTVALNYFIYYCIIERYKKEIKNG